MKLILMGYYLKSMAQHRNICTYYQKRLLQQSFTVFHYPVKEIASHLYVCGLISKGCEDILQFDLFNQIILGGSIAYNELVRFLKEKYRNCPNLYLPLINFDFPELYRWVVISRQTGQVLSTSNIYYENKLDCLIEGKRAIKSENTMFLSIESRCYCLKNTEGEFPNAKCFCFDNNVKSSSQIHIEHCRIWIPSLSNNNQ